LSIQKEWIQRIQDDLIISDKDCETIISKAIAGGEINDNISVEEWLSKRFIPNCVVINKYNYTRMCIDALKILSKTAPTDFGSSRQRDLGQLWADMTRGYLGEQAVVQFLEDKYKIKTTLGHERGELQNYLPTDIHTVIRNGIEKKPCIYVGIKSAKLNCIWHDIPGDQFSHSDVHILVKVGVGRDHLFSFFKEISVFKDKILKQGEAVGSLTKSESSMLFPSLPSFNPIIAYVCGFAIKDQSYRSLSYKGKKGRKHFTIKEWNGPIKSGDIDKIKQLEGISGEVKFESIRRFSHDNGYLFNTGSLLWTRNDWETIVNRL
jgi:hypothetical protein